MTKTRLEGYGTLLPAKWRDIYEQVEGANSDEGPQSARAAAGVPDQVATCVLMPEPVSQIHDAALGKTSGVPLNRDRV